MLANCRLQFLLDRLGRCLKLFVSTDSTSCHQFVPQFGLECYIREKHPTLSQILRRTRYCLFERSRALPVIQCRRKGGVNFVCASVCVCVCVRMCVRACVRDVFAIYDNNTLTRLIIIKMIFLYFIEIAHTDDFPSTGTRLVNIILNSQT